MGFPLTVSQLLDDVKVIFFCEKIETITHFEKYGSFNVQLGPKSLFFDSKCYLRQNLTLLCYLKRHLLRYFGIFVSLCHTFTPFINPLRHKEIIFLMLSNYQNIFLVFFLKFSSLFWLQTLKRKTL